MPTRGRVAPPSGRRGPLLKAGQACAVPAPVDAPVAMPSACGCVHHPSAMSSVCGSTRCPTCWEVWGLGTPFPRRPGSIPGLGNFAVCPKECISWVYKAVICCSTQSAATRGHSGTAARGLMEYRSGVDAWSVSAGLINYAARAATAGRPSPSPDCSCCRRPGHLCHGALRLHHVRHCDAIIKK